MPTWDEIDKKSFLNQWIPSKTHRQNFRKMFDLHCKNKDPWTWDYQWVYNCWKNNGLSINPSFNLVSNIGVGPNASNTKHKTQIELYPSFIGTISFPLKHPLVKRNIDFEKEYYKALKLPLIRRIKNKIKSWL